MDKVFAVLILEDRKADLELTRRALIKSFPSATITHAANEKEFKERLSWMTYDLILADYYLPGYNGLEALLYVRETKPHLPFIFVTGTLNSEEAAAKAILQGANGYVLKDNLKELSAQITTALLIAEKQKKKQEEVNRKNSIAKLKMQKVIGLLEGSPEFPNRKVSIALLSELVSS